MNRIPASLLPKTLERQISLSKVGKITIEHNRKSSMFIPTLVFLKRYGPSVKFYNEHLKFERAIKDLKTPIVTIYDTQNAQVDQFDSATFTPEEIINRILEANQKLGGETAEKL